MSSSLAGGCLCGKIRYAVSADKSIYNVICHCINCKKATGTHMANTSLFPKEVGILLPLNKARKEKERKKRGKINNATADLYYYYLLSLAFRSSP